jgi:2,3-bisphosphoglycerate-independent phosphoglycerate mutase
MELDSNGKMVVSTQHSLNPVPFWVLGKDVQLRKEGIIPDVGVTVLDLMGLKKPKDMTAESLIV